MVADEAPGLGDDALGVEGGAPVVRFAAGRVGGPAVEEVRAVLDAVADLAAEQGVHGEPEGLAERVQAGHLEAGDDGEPELPGRLRAAQPARVHPVVGGAWIAAHLVGQREEPVHLTDRAAGQGAGEGLRELQVGAVAVGLPDAGHAAAGDDLHDEPGGVRLVDALGVQQGRVGDEDRGEPDGVDQQGCIHT